jgi:SAM-dependent methyltransferase
MGNVYTAVKQTARQLMESTTPGYRFLLRRGLQVRGHLNPPHAPWHNAVLQTRQERDRAIEQVTNLGLPLVTDAPKNWDCLAALDCILGNTLKRARVLDAGSELYSRILPWLCLYGYKELFGINLVFKERTKRGPITYKYGDVTRTDFDPVSFDAIACLSVIEHGVDLEAYFREMSRLLKPGGVLITSTDYWQTRIDTKGQKMYDVPVHIFTQSDIVQAIELAERYGFALTAPIDFGCNERVVQWERTGLDYTFLIFTLRKAV